MKYAVIKLLGHQYKVESDDLITVDRSNEKILKPQVLLWVDGPDIQIGSPYLEKVNVELEKVEDKKGEKIYVKKYKAKSRYRKKIGFRPSLSTFRVKIK